MDTFEREGLAVRLPPLAQDERAMARFRAFARVAAWATMLVSTLDLAGWLGGIPTLTSLLPDQQSMKAGTAVGLFLAATALLAHLRPRRPAWACALPSLAVLALGAGNLAQYLSRRDLGLDWGLGDIYAMAHGMPPGRMSQLTALAFVLLGGVGLAGCWRRSLWLRESLAVALLALSVLALAYFGAQLGGVGELPVTPMAMPTAVLLLAMTLAWMAASPDLGLTRIATANSLGGSLARRLLLPTLLLPVAVVLALRAMQLGWGMGDGLALALAALFSGGSLAWMVWWVALLVDRGERQQRQAQRLRDDAATDGLTGLGNRRAFDAALGKMLRGRRERDAEFCLLMIDLDWFKRYNDDYGHLAGDDALRATAALLRQALRPGDLPMRYGGEEFALLLPGTNAAEARAVAERILADFRSHAWPLRPVTVSIGLAEAHADDLAEGLIDRADAALYDAKHAGRDRVAVAAAAPGAN